MSVFAVVVSYNDVARTLACVASLKDQVDLVVWDNASEDGTPRAIAAAYPDVIVHDNDQNVLWTPALNGAIERYYEDQDFILASNNDIFYKPNTIRLMKDAHRDLSKERAGILAPSGSMLGGLQDFVVHHRPPARVPFDDWVSTRPTVRANFVVGASMLVSRECFYDVGMFDADMPLGADDHDYCLRAKEKDWSIWVVNSAYVEHVGHASFEKARATWNEWGEKSWAWFNEKWDGYFYDEEEAIKCHWAGTYTPGWDKGTGWLSEEQRERVYSGR